jgi:DNA helicase-2/ATP-dependent DNA helicase PcrA
MPEKKPQKMNPRVAALNDPQREAVLTPSGPLLVLAGAGSGKTRVVTVRIAELIAGGIKPDRILAVTFTNKAAAEMQERVGELLGKQLKERPVISTFHSHCVRVLRRHIDLLGYPKRFAIYDRGDQESVARGVLREINVPGSTLKPGDLLAIISNWKVRSVRPPRAESLATTDREHLAAMGYRRYQNALKLAGAVDFDDLLLCTQELFENFPAARREEAALFDHLLIDEYQDTNENQYRIVKALASGHRNLCVVGDDDQSIYAWRGAVVEHILSFKRDWPDAKVVRLEDNYRSTEAILALANEVIAHNKIRHPKVLKAARKGGERPTIQQYETEDQEAEEVVKDICRRITQPDVDPRDFAILFRTNEQPRAFETEMRRVNLPYVLLGGQSFFDRKEVRDILAYLRVIDFPRDEISLLRTINNPPRGIGQKTVEALMKQSLGEKQPIWETIKHASAVPGVADAPAAAIERFTKLINRFRRQAKKGSLADLAKNLIDGINYRAEIERLYQSPEERDARWTSVEQVITAIAAYERQSTNPSLKNFLDNTVLDGRDMDNDKDEQLKGNAVALLTMHAAKGLEYPYVYMVGMEEGLLPHKRSVAENEAAIAEERRLCYVGITRAQERLTLSLALTRMKWGKPRETIPSRFLFEMIGQSEKAAQVVERAEKELKPKSYRR